MGQTVIGRSIGIALRVLAIRNRVKRLSWALMGLEPGVWAVQVGGTYKRPDSSLGWMPPMNR